MDIREYLDERGISVRKMSELMGCSCSVLDKVTGKRHRAGYNFAKKIEVYTRGKVLAHDILTWKLREKNPAHCQNEPN